MRTMRCPACGFDNAQANRFCGGCGGALPGASSGPTGERRHVTVLFADLADFTRLTAARDPEDTRDMLGRLFETLDGIVTRYGGHVDKHIGDNVMAVFGAPVSHGNDAERACAAALAMHEAVAALGRSIALPLELHVGVASGTVVASTLGSARFSEYTVTGDAVNLASRLQGEAGAGETLVCAATVEAARGRIDCAPAGERQIKGLDRPVGVHRLHAVGRIAEPTDRPLVGRERELARLRALIDGCAARGAGGVAVLRGEAGIGKSRLTEAARAAATAAGLAVVTGLVLDFGAARDAGAIGATVRGLVTAAWDATADSHGIDTLRAAGRLAPEEAAPLRAVLGLALPDDERGLYESMAPAIRGARQQAAIDRVARAAAERRPVLLVMEDTHWADDATADALAALGRTARAAPIALVATTRLEGERTGPDWWASQGVDDVAAITLAPLDAGDAAALAAAHGADPEAVARCVARAGGNPLFLEQLARTADRGGEAMPETLHGLVLARLDRLPPADRRAAQAAAVFGQRFPPDGLAAVLAAPGDACAGLSAAGLVRPLGAEMLFDHALIRDGIYASLTRASRRELHAAAARWYDGRDPLLRAEHLERAEAPEAAGAYLAAARGLAADYRGAEATAAARRGMALAATDGERFALLALVGEIERESGDARASRATYGEALALAPDDRARCAALIGVAAAERQLGAVDEAHAALDRAEAIAARDGLTPDLAAIHYHRGSLHFARGLTEECRIAHEAALAAATAADAPELQARALSGLGDALYSVGRMRSARDMFARCVALAERLGLGRVAASNRVMIGHCLLYLGEPDAGVALIRESAEAARRAGNRFGEMFARQSAGMILTFWGADEAAEAEQAPALEMARALGSRRFESILLVQRAACALRRGDRAGARGLAEEAIAVCRDIGYSFGGAMAFAVLASAIDDPAGRRAALAEGEAALGGTAASHNHFWFAYFAIDAAAGLGDWAAARRFADALEAYTRAEPLPLSDFLVARGRALADAGGAAPDDAVRARLAAVAAEARRLDMAAALPALDAALAAGATVRPV
ncbi:MAG: adenylate/guanylate cyclase domain-containing protein [Rhodospirillaceae bacterium]